MYEFSRLEEEPEPQASGSRFGPPRKYTAASLLGRRNFRLFVQGVSDVRGRW
jgi:hypothetical protein